MNLFKITLYVLLVHGSIVAENAWNFIINGSPLSCTGPSADQFWLCSGEEYSGLIYHKACGAGVAFSPMLMSQNGVELNFTIEAWNDENDFDLLGSNKLTFSYRDYFAFKKESVQDELAELIYRKDKNSSSIINNGNNFIRGLRIFFNHLKNAEFTQHLTVKNRTLFSEFHIRDLQKVKGPNTLIPFLGKETLPPNYALHHEKIVSQPGVASTLSDAQEIFRKISARTDLAFNYTDDGCYARAHIIAYELFKQGLRTGKIWLAGDLRDPTKPDSSWAFHVAALIYVRNEDNASIEPYVIDPSLDPENLLSVEEWLAKNNLPNRPQLISFPIPEECEFFEPAVMAFSSHIPLYPFEYETWIPLAETLREATEENERNLKELKINKFIYFN